MKINFTISIALILLFASGCTSMGSGEPTKDMITADVANEMIRTALEEQRGEMSKKKETEVAFTLLADPDVNSRANAVRRGFNQPQSGTPISVKILQLTDDSMLLSADQESLNQNLESALGKTYIDHSDYVLTPGQFKFVDFEMLDEKARYIGVVAGYHDINRSTWKRVIKLDSRNKKQPLFVRLTMQEVVVKTED